MIYLSAQGVYIETPEGQPLVHDLNLCCHAHEVWGILGENGVGKSTLLRTLAGLYEAKKGDIALLNHPITDSPSTLAKIRSYLPQQTTYPAEQTLEEVVLSHRYPYQRFWEFQPSISDHAIAVDAIKTLQLEPLKKRPVGTLSGGEARRAAIAGVLAQQTPLILLDEPTTFLDLRHQHRVLSHIAALCQQQAFSAMMVLQDPNLALSYCTHSLLLFTDQKWLAGPTDQVLTAAHLTQLYHHPIVSIPWQARRYFATA